MIYAYDTGVQLPISSIYDTQMMLAQVAAVKDMYEKAEQEMKDFKKEYSDFYSSRPSDMEWYNKEYNKIKYTLNDLYQRDIDPLRSQEGRLAMRTAMRNFDVAEYAKRKKSAAVYDEYMKNLAILDQKGLYNEGYEKWRLAKEGKSLNDVVFDQHSPAAYIDEYNLTSDIFKDIKPELIRTDRQSGMDYFGVTRERRKAALNSKLDSILGTGSGRYMYDQAKQQLGPNASEEDIRNAVSNRILDATSAMYDYEMPKENPIIKRQRDKAAEISAYRQKKIIDAQYDNNKPNNNVQLNFTQQQVQNVKAKRKLGTAKVVNDAYRSVIANGMEMRKSQTQSNVKKYNNSVVSYFDALRQHVSTPVNTNFGLVAFLGGNQDDISIPETRMKGKQIMFDGDTRYNLEASRLSSSTGNKGVKLSGSASMLNNRIQNSGLVGYALSDRTTSDVYDDGTVDIVANVAFKKDSIDKLFGRPLSNYEKQILGITEFYPMPGVKRAANATHTDELLYDQQVYYSIPMARTIDNNGGQTRGEIDMLYDKYTIGANEASENRTINQAKSSVGI